MFPYHRLVPGTAAANAAIVYLELAVMGEATALVQVAETDEKSPKAEQETAAMPWSDHPGHTASHSFLIVLAVPA